MSNEIDSIVLNKAIRFVDSEQQSCTRTELFESKHFFQWNSKWNSKARTAQSHVLIYEVSLITKSTLIISPSQEVFDLLAGLCVLPVRKADPLVNQAWGCAIQYILFAIFVLQSLWDHKASYVRIEQDWEELNDFTNHFADWRCEPQYRIVIPNL